MVSVDGLAAKAPPVTAKAPPVTASVYEESIPMLYASSLVYATATVLAKVRKAGIKLKIPEDSPLTEEYLAKFKEQSCDFREFNNGNGLTFGEVNALFDLNKDTILKVLEEEDVVEAEKETFNMELVEDLKKYFEASEGAAGEKPEDRVFLSTFRSVRSRVSCVYGVVKDTNNKIIIVSFRGSQSIKETRDWQTNVNFKLEALPTPEKIKDKMEGKLKKRVLVHEGFYKYLNENDRLDGKALQRTERIMEDIESLLKNEEGYSVYVTGHSLGGALATLFAFQIAGAGPEYNFLPRPVNLISYAAPFSGTSGYRKAYEQMELNGLIRNLRVTVDNDLVPSLAPLSIGRLRSMKHTGINLRLKENGYSLLHSSEDGLVNKINNSLIKPFWGMLYYHALDTYDERMNANMKDLNSMKLDDLYKDPKIVDKEFLEAKEKTSDEL
eukprot:jgi/Psemu1/261579/estExt_Genewise1Plus.C_5950030